MCSHTGEMAVLQTLARRALAEFMMLARASATSRALLRTSFIEFVPLCSQSAAYGGWTEGGPRRRLMRGAMCRRASQQSRVRRHLYSAHQKAGTERVCIELTHGIDPPKGVAVGDTVALLRSNGYTPRRVSHRRGRVGEGAHVKSWLKLAKSMFGLRRSAMVGEVGDVGRRERQGTGRGRRSVCWRRVRERGTRSR